MHLRVTLPLASAFVLAACGGGTTTPPPPIPTTSVQPALATAPKARGEIVITGDASPASHGPYRFDGDYTVRFEQIAPEDPNLDFTTATSFVVSLDRRAEIADGASIALFDAARAKQTRKLRIDGRFYVDVSFGDYPYVIRFTPRT